MMRLALVLLLVGCGGHPDTRPSDFQTAPPALEVQP